VLAGRTRVCVWLEQPTGSGQPVLAFTSAHAAVGGPAVYLPQPEATELFDIVAGLLQTAGGGAAGG
jgi:hypothetical protein